MMTATEKKWVMEQKAEKQIARWVKQLGKTVSRFGGGILLRNTKVYTIPITESHFQSQNS